MAFEMSDDAFELLVEDALDQIPKDFLRLMDNVAIFIEDRYQPLAHEDPTTVLLGLYEGVALTERDGGWGAG
ncbi:MAG: metallopeptidase family protein, partial [Pseudolysinimonas sp.]